MAILKLPAKNYLESVDRAERALMQVGVFRHYKITKGEGFIFLDVDDDFAEDVKGIYHSYEPPSA